MPTLDPANYPALAGMDPALAKAWLEGRFGMISMGIVAWSGRQGAMVRDRCVLLRVRYDDEAFHVSAIGLSPLFHDNFSMEDPACYRISTDNYQKTRFHHFYQVGGKDAEAMRVLFQRGV